MKIRLEVCNEILEDVDSVEEFKFTKLMRIDKGVWDLYTDEVTAYPILDKESTMYKLISIIEEGTLYIRLRSNEDEYGSIVYKVDDVKVWYHSR